MKNLWPELFVALLFLLGDLLWDGLEAALAGVAAGVTAFLILLLLKRRKPGLLLEGLVFGAVTALGEVLDYPGGSLLLAELVFGLILLLSVVLGRNLISGMAGGFGRGLFSEKQSTVIAVTMGLLFVAHSLLSAVLSLMGYLTLWLGVVFFLIMYFIAVKLSRNQMQRAVAESLPVLKGLEDGVYELVKTDKNLGQIRLVDEEGSVVTVEVLPESPLSPEFLDVLGEALKRRGVKTMVLGRWPGDDLELEMRGFVSFAGRWRKRL